MALPHPYSHCTVKYAEAEGERPKLLLGTQVYFPASSGFTRKMIRVPSIKIRTLNFRSLQTNKKTRMGRGWHGGEKVFQEPAQQGSKESPHPAKKARRASTSSHSWPLSRPLCADIGLAPGTDWMASL